MKKPTTKLKSTASFPPEFLPFWKEHEHSGFVEDSNRKWHWNITPRLAWNCARYRTEFTQEDEYFSKEDIAR